MIGCSKPPLTYDEQISLGNKYLTEGNYKEAILSFEAAIIIDPKSIPAYLGIADAYIALGDTESAVATLKKGFDATQSEEILARIDNITSEIDKTVTPSELSIDEMAKVQSSEFMKKLYEICLTGDMNALRDMMRTEEYKNIAALSTSITPLLYFPDTETGTKGVGLYDRRLYYGEYIDSIRSGKGYWLAVDEKIDYWMYDGGWENDIPNGYGSQTFCKSSGETWTDSGNVVNGLWDGILKTTNSSGEEYSVIYKAGIEDGQSANDGSLYDNYGVCGFFGPDTHK